ncbi:MAG: NAD(+) synthase [Synergistaceae bacterium]|jgi:NAD+ synthase (glutamine-hydrolysing)|nr:NAD(+) synthase [Synergistaceae bacterium]
MKGSLDGFVRAAAATPTIRVADCAGNAEQILALIEKASRRGVSLLCLPELCITGYTCGELFLQETLLASAVLALSQIVRESREFPVAVIAGLPLVERGKLYNVAAVFCRGRVLGFVPKSCMPTYGEFYELRHFSPAFSDNRTVTFDGNPVPMGPRLLFACDGESAFRIGVEICEDLWVPSPPSVSHALAGATVIANASASDELIGKAAYRRMLAASQSGRLVCAYLYAGAGQGESTTDMVFSGHDLICENGALLSESRPFGDGWAESEIDLRILEYDRRRMNTWGAGQPQAPYETVPFSLDAGVRELRRRVDPYPFVPDDESERNSRCEAILDMQVSGLAKRLSHTGAKCAVIGVSGGLDSCLALLVTARAMTRLGRSPSDICAITMPCFGTTERTRGNAHSLCKSLGVECRDIDISETVLAHLRDIGVPITSRDVVYENAQARVRTLVLMDMANQLGGLVVGTGDLSELALGWSTYNGDHMSMYGVNAGVPKTLVRHIVKYAADAAPKLSPVLEDILSTPVSPELLPPSGEDIAQKTESIIGPYELHDFFLYHVVRWGRSPSSVYGLAVIAFGGRYESGVILKWLRVFCERFFAQQFKRSCLPDGPKIGSVSMSPRGDLRMPSDAVCSAWSAELDKLES